MTLFTFYDHIMINRRTVLYTVLAVSLLLGSATEATAKSYCERLYDAARRDYYALLKSERKQRFHDSWDRVIDKFSQIVDKYPGCSKAPDSLFNIGVLYRKLYRKSWLRKDLESGLDAFRRLAKKYPKSKLADDALLMAAEIQEEKGDKKSAYKAYDSIVRSYPKGDMTGQAKGKLKQLARYAPTRKKTPVSSGSKKVTITRIRQWSNPEYSRVVVYATGKVSFTKHKLKKDSAAGKPPRLYLDLKRATVPVSLTDPIPIRDGLLLQARVGQYDKDTVRVVLDIDNMTDHRVFTMENPARVVVDVMGKKAAGTSSGTFSPGAKMGTPIPLVKQLGLGVRRIVLDPGHGGKDPGAVGRRGSKEKEITLALAKKIKPLLVAKGYEVLLTRTTDKYVGLDERTAFANKNQADLFVSIHTNASRSRKARGIETYFLGVARDRESSETAMLENAISEQTLADLERILLDLTRTSNLKQSSLLAESVQDSLYKGLKAKYSNVRNHGVKQASFYVLIGAQMPAVLVETSFITHPGEEKLLASNSYREVVGQSIYRGIVQYIEKVLAMVSLEAS